MTNFTDLQKWGVFEKPQNLRSVSNLGFSKNITTEAGGVGESAVFGLSLVIFGVLKITQKWLVFGRSAVFWPSLGHFWLLKITPKWPLIVKNDPKKCPGVYRKYKVSNSKCFTSQTNVGESWRLSAVGHFDQGTAEISHSSRTISSSYLSSPDAKQHPRLQIFLLQCIKNFRHSAASLPRRRASLKVPSAPTRRLATGFGLPESGENLLTHCSRNIWRRGRCFAAGELK